MVTLCMKKEIYFPASELSYTEQQTNNLKRAFPTSNHKSQGNSLNLGTNEFFYAPKDPNRIK